MDQNRVDIGICLHRVQCPRYVQDNFQLHRFTRRENTAKSFRGATFSDSHCISVSWTVLAWFTSVTERQTDRHYLSKCYTLRGGVEVPTWNQRTSAWRRSWRDVHAEFSAFSLALGSLARGWWSSALVMCRPPVCVTPAVIDTTSINEYRLLASWSRQRRFGRTF